MINHYVYVVFADGLEPQVYDPGSSEFRPPEHTARKSAMQGARLLKSDGFKNVRVEMHNLKHAQREDYDHPIAIVSLETARPGHGPGSYSFREGSP